MLQRAEHVVTRTLWISGRQLTRGCGTLEKDESLSLSREHNHCQVIVREINVLKMREVSEVCVCVCACVGGVGGG